MAESRISARPILEGRATHAALAIAALAIALSHLLMLAARLRDASISEPAVALRWSGALGVLLFAAALRRRGRQLVQGRSGLVLALIVLTLHLGVSPATALDPRTESLLLEAPLGLAGAVLLGRVARLVASRRVRASRLLPQRPVRMPPPRLALAAGGVRIAFLPRPPPPG